METCKYLFISNLFKDLAICICQKLPNHAIFAEQVIQMFAFLRTNVTNIDSYSVFNILYLEVHWYIVVLSCKITVNANQVTTRFLDIYMTRKEINTGECCNIDVCDMVVQLCVNYMQKYVSEINFQTSAINCCM